MSSIANCSNCHTRLRLPRRAVSFRCPICQAMNQRGSSAPAPTPPPSSFNGNNNNKAPPTSGTGNKKALIIGILYKKTRYELQGCINDAKSIKKLLMSRFKFPEASILMLTDEETNKPTKQNIMKGMNWLIQGCQPGDSLFFHYSGHGSQQKHLKGEELDGYDELLWPLDFETNGMIIDDVINETIVNPLPTGVKLHAIIDACHSGTALDLPFLCRMDRTGKFVWEDHNPKTGTWKGTHGEAIFFSGCDDHQLSSDSAVGRNGPPIGAMTYAFTQAIEHGQGTTYGSILNSMRSTISKTDNDQGQGGGAAKPNLSMLLTGGAKLIQEPQLSACKPFDVYTKLFSL